MASYRQDGTVLADRTFSVPLDHDRPEPAELAAGAAVPAVT
jgi:hypothetical protein